MQILADFIRKRIIGFTKIILELQFKIRVFGEENIPAQASGTLIIANHSSYLDVFVVGIAFFRNAINIRWVISKANYRILSLLIRKKSKNHRWIKPRRKYLTASTR